MTYKNRELSPNNAHSLRPLVIAISAALVSSSLLTGCFHNGNNRHSAATTMNFAGGSGGTTGGVGGDGGYAYLYMDGDALGLVNIFTGSSGAPSSSDIPDFTADTGANPLGIATDTTLTRTATEPAAGVAYQAVDGCEVYIADGAEGADTPVTGMSIDDGVTLTLEAADISGNAEACFTDDVESAGTITTADGYGGARTDLYMQADNFFSSGAIDVSGDAAYGDGGNVVIETDTAFYNLGTIDTSGVSFTEAAPAIVVDDTGDGGDGGDIDLYARDGSFFNFGDMTSAGGDSASGYGGDGGAIHFYAYGGMINAGDMTMNGGDGADSGGSAGYAWFEILDGKDDDTAQNLEIAGNFDARGGAVTGATGDGGSGGGVYFYVANTIAGEESELNVYGVSEFDASGADGYGGGGDGGDVGLYIADGTSLTNAADIDITGGDAVAGSGGDGGTANLYFGDGAAIITSGDIVANGGEVTGSGDGGEGGNIALYTVGGAGDVTNSGALSANGGATAAGYGGGGGFIELYVDVGNVSNTANLAANGGSSSDGYGGSGGTIGLYVNDGDITTSGDIAANGANGSLGGGDGGTVYQYAYGGLTTSGDIDATGGDATTSGYGGDGGFVGLYSLDGTDDANVTVDVSVGTGVAGDGATGAYYLDHVAQ